MCEKYETHTCKNLEMPTWYYAKCSDLDEGKKRTRKIVCRRIIISSVTFEESLFFRSELILQVKFFLFIMSNEQNKRTIHIIKVPKFLNKEKI